MLVDKEENSVNFDYQFIMNQRKVGIGISPPPYYYTRGLGLQQHPTTPIAIPTDENLDLFSRNPRIFFNSYSSDESDSGAAAAVSMKLGRLSVASMKLSSRSEIDHLFSSADDNNSHDDDDDDGEAGKHDYDWLLTPPGTPLVSSSDANQPQSAAAGPRRTASVRSVSTTKSSRLSAAQPVNNYSSRPTPTRSSSVTRPSISTTNYTSFPANKSSSSILNTSSQSVTSISRPSTPSSRPSLPPSARPSTPTSTPGARASRPSTPSRSRSITTTTTSVAKTQTPQSSRPSTPTSRTQVSTNSNSLAARSNSRPSTPTRRNPTPGPPQLRGRSASVGPPLTNSRSSSVASRGSSPAPRTRSMHQPIVPPDFPLDTPPNLRTTMPDRPVSAGRSRPGAGLAPNRKSEASGPVNPSRRQSPSPITTRGRLSEPITKGRSQVNGHHHVNAVDNQKMPPNSEAAPRRPLKPATSTDSTGFGRTISKKSIDMALRHMDIHNGSTGGGRSLSGISVFPQSVRPGMPKGGVGLHRGARVLDSYPPRSTSGNNVRKPGHSNTPSMSDNGSISCLDRSQGCETEEIDSRFTGKLCESDIYDSSRYDMMLLKEDPKNTNWLQTIDDKSDLFDQPFEPLPEPFNPL